jgi:hypothetical protein
MIRAAARGRWALYAVALGATLLAVRWAGGQDETVARPSREARDERPVPRAEAAAPREALPALDVSLLGARAAAASARDLFPAVSWAQQAREEEVKRNPPPKPAPPPPPQAPPVPFAYMGKLVEDGATTVFLTQGDRPLIARAGETLGGAWRVDRIDEQSMTFTYLPLARPQTLAFAAASPNAAGPAAPDAPSEPADRGAKDD